MALKGKDVQFSCSANSEPSHNVQWIFNGKSLNNDSQNYKFTRNETHDLLTIFNVTSNETGLYTCVLFNVHGRTNASASLVVQGKLIN